MSSVVLPYRGIYVVVFGVTFLDARAFSPSVELHEVVRLAWCVLGPSGHGSRLGC